MNSEYLEIYDENRNKTGKIVERGKFKLEPGEFFLVTEAILINSNNEIILCHNNGTYQFPGGHYDRNDVSLEKCLEREIQEELGITTTIVNGPFLLVETYYDNYFDTGDKVCCKIYYFRVLTDSFFDLSKTSYDVLESMTNFNILYLNLSLLHSFLLDSLKAGTIDPNICKEMLYATKEYSEIYGG